MDEMEGLEGGVNGSLGGVEVIAYKRHECRSSGKGKVLTNIGRGIGRLLFVRRT